MQRQAGRRSTSTEPTGGAVVFTSLLTWMIFSMTAWCATKAPVDAPARTEYLADVWDSDRGLPSYSVNAFAQTPDGYLWIATFQGLARFDGVQFDVIDHAKTPEFPGTAVTGLLSDRKGLLWAGTDNGIACLKQGRWVAYADPDGQPIKLAMGLFEDREGNVMAMAHERLLKFAGDRFVVVPTPPGTYMARSFASGDGDLWLHASGHFAHMQAVGWQSIPLPPEMSDGLVQGAAASRDGGVWVAGSHSLEKFRNGHWSQLFPALPASTLFTRVTQFLEDSAGNLWVGDHSKGLLLFRPDGRMLRFTRQDGLPNFAIRALFEDREKNIWVGTDGGGMARFRPRAVNFFDEADGLSEIVLDSVAASSAGDLLVGTYGGGLVRFNETLRRFGPPIEQQGVKPPHLHAASLVLSVMEDRSGTVWAGVFGRGLFRIRGSTMEQTLPEELGRGAQPFALLQDSRGTMWMGTNAGVSSYQDGKFTNYGRGSGLVPGDYTALAEDGHGEIWAGGPGLFHLHDGAFQAFAPPGGSPYPGVVSLYATKDGAFWVGAENRGLDRWRDGKLTSFGLPQGLPGSLVASMVEDNQGRLWLGTSRQGLVCVPFASFDAVADGRQAKLDVIWLKKEDGLPSNEFRRKHQPGAWKGPDGRLWFATLKGLVVVDPGRIQRNPALPPVLIEAVGIDGRKIVLPQTPSGALQLDAGSRRVQFFYAALSFAAPERVRFQYQLEGLDRNWLETADRSASFGDLRPGEYVFRVRGANNDGLWNPQPAELRVRVAPYFWERWWVRFLAMGLLSMVTAAAVYASQRKRLDSQMQKLEQERTLRRDVERLQSGLKASEDRFSKAFHASPLPMTIASLDEGRFLDVNQSFLDRTGCRRDEVIGRTRAELGLWDDEFVRGRFQDALRAEGRVRAHEVKMRDRRGETHFLLVSAEVLDLDGIRCLLSVSHDITDRKHLEEQLNQAQKLESVGRLAGGVAHDFNNLLTVINGYCDLLLMQPETADLTRRRVEQIRKAGERAAEVTQQLLAFSRKQVIRPKELNLNSLVTETETMLRRLLPENIEMVTRLEPALGLVMADPGQIHQVLLNLALNARDAMPAGGHLIMETANVELDEQYCGSHPEVTPGPCVFLAVSDTGAGMDEDLRSHIFEPFFTTKAVGAGTGLGLATVYGIVRQSGGWVWVYSEPGRGTSFKIYFPRVGHSAPESRELPVGQSFIGTETVLLVEDQPDVRSLAKEVLAESGYCVIEASCGREALELAGQHNGPIHLLLTDVVMPGMTGKDLAERLIALRPQTKVLFMSGYTENVIAHRGALKRGIAFVPKPLTPETLMTKVRETLG